MKNPLITMCAITGKPTKEQIFDYMNSLCENGIKQVMLYPRSGCELEYLGDEWFETIGEYINAAKSLDMSIWLYDDFNWPSGYAGGKVTEIEEYRLKAIEVRGDNIGKITVPSVRTASMFGEKFLPDLFSEKAVDYFIECTHEKYYEKFGEYFGSIIKGIFTDEPSVAYCCNSNSFPYYDGMKEDYQKCFGRSFDDDMRECSKEFCINISELIGEKFTKSFTEKISKWCEAHNILLTGHLLSDSTPGGAIRQNGDFLKNLSAFSMPGIDEIFTDFKSPELLTLLGAAEYASNENGAMAELFALGPVDITYEAKRCMIYLAACFKINRYFLAVSPLDIRGNRLITDYFNIFTADQPDFCGMKIFAREAERASEYAEKDYTAQVYLRYPKKECASRLLDKKNDDPFFNLAMRLSYYQIQWKLIADEVSCDNIPVIDISLEREYIFGDMVTTDVEQVCQSFEKSIILTDEKGNIPNGIFVRKYNDGSCVTVNYCGEAGTYILNGKKIYLEKHGVYEGDSYPDYYVSENKQPISAKFEISYANDNLIRAMYINSQANFEIINNSDKAVRFAVRNDVSAYLDDIKISCNECKNELSAGFSNLYGVSDTVTLPKGKSILKSEDDYKYFPSVFIMGDFSAESYSGEICGVNLKCRKATYIPGEYFSDFGKVDLSTEVYVPERVKAVEIKGSKLYTILNINGKITGERICSPYIYPIDEALCGKTVKLTVTQYSSLGPIFGDIEYFEKNSERVKWRGTPLPENNIFGFGELHWIFNE